MRFAGLAIGLLCAASASADEPYRLPWPEGLSFMFTQVSDGRVTTHFTKATLHAVDIAMPVGVRILAARPGVIEAVEMSQGANAEEEPLSYEGNLVRVRHGDGTAAIYAHLRHGSAAVTVGQPVALTQLLAYSGASGDVLEPHLHFAVLRDDASIPVRFYVGAPPVVFAARAALRVTANYSDPVSAPRTPREAEPLVPWHRAPLESGGEEKGWRLLAAWLACGVVAFVLFWKFSKN
jgi:murein DD-endopeptidase MepM/ murein hydrolase activator NlpD